MSLRRFLILLCAAYVGGLIATYLAMLVMSPSDFASPIYRFWPFSLAVGIMLWTVPGLLWVAFVYRLIGMRHSKATARWVAISVGTITGGTALWSLSDGGLAVFLMGAGYGFVTSCVWMALRRFPPV